ncbi:PEP-CTERM sorting domain-containing protein [Thalassotalea atypica]|uniref:PEP-CTERM sorting domain-containing protein n=1 Tax=Thalassotalea atypica TaxID=2054316 RepID=UPI0025733E66|nr:PEP-CTERM sorting domain-containing protein [Thalassotalea atypica]
MRKFILIASLLFSMNANAVLLTELLNGGSITVGDKLFDQWEVIFEDSSDFSFNGVNTDDIDVTGLPDGGLDPGPGLHFEVANDALSILGDGLFFSYLDFHFGFRVSVLDDDFLIKDNSLYLTDYGLSLDPLGLQAGVFIEEWIHSDATRLNQIGHKDVYAYDEGFGEDTKLSDAADFTPTNEIWVRKNILVSATEFGDFATLNSFEQRFSQTTIPEPSMFLLLALGLFGIAVKRKRS